jgi:hypothetical protein
MLTPALIKKNPFMIFRPSNSSLELDEMEELEEPIVRNIVPTSPIAVVQMSRERD